jgi:uncharacterized protein YbjT (DUF2867 family)
VIAALEADAVPIRALVRDPRAAADSLRGARDVELIGGDLADEAAVKRALAGIDAVFVALRHPEIRELELALGEAAARAGVRRYVKVSVLGASARDPVLRARIHFEIEERLRELGLSPTCLRIGMVVHNLLDDAPQIGLGELAAAAGEAAVAWIHPDDIAAVARVALTGPGTDLGVLELTGPEALTYRELAARLTALLGKPVRYVELSDEQQLAVATAAGAPAWAAEHLRSVYRDSVRAGRLGRVTGDVGQTTGRPALPIDGWVTDHAECFGGRPLTPPRRFGS